MSRRITLSCSCVLLVGLLGFAGCYETAVLLSPASESKINLSYIGDFTDSSGQPQFVLHIRNLDDHDYFVEYREPGKDEATRMVGHFTDIHGVTFAQMRGLSDDGKNDAKYLTLRMSLTGDTLEFQNLNDKFFEKKSVDTPEKLRQVIEANLDNPEMYDGEKSTAKREPAKSTQPAP